MTTNIFQIAERHWAKGAPVDVQAIIREAGVEYKEMPKPSSVSGLIEAYGGGYRIVVNSDHSLVRRRFTAAHELGHYVYHRDIIGDGIVDDAAYRSERIGQYGGKIRPEYETQANRFAAIILMPTVLLDQLQAKQTPIPEMARQLQVSVEALRIRLGIAD
ncbi:ImmA/IrrE family metallo-endopeptidase [Bradyrhizobium sp. dw_411]|uniref:ImmA/IrrE family metallo-endopeptidase n=1 Tax=Bradyrhizobium sp. dw_411 TaxID=2720082 RepID=UPI001BD0D39E|nr:ImmA/IrrE family metallo-endopeptidase [Bradyrhizobium sp. dw_411]